MQYKKLGKTDLNISVIGFGAWAIGGNMWGYQDDNHSILALNKAIDLGVNFIDTASAYGNGHSEKIIGSVLRNKKEKIYVATKIPVPSWPPSPTSSSLEVFPKERIFKYVHESLKNLQIDCIDLIQLHSWRKNWIGENQWYETLCDLRKQGKIKFIGVSVHDNLEDEALDLIETNKIDTIQVVYNVLSQSPSKNLFPKALKFNIGIIARVPLAYGALTGKFTKDTKFEENDFRKNKYSEPNMMELLEKVNDFKIKVGSSEKKDLVSAALRFSLNHNVVSTTIPGIRNENQAIENCLAIENLKITKDILDNLAIK